MKHFLKLRKMSNYKNTTINGQSCIWLQSFGYCPAKPASELKEGDTIVYNFGHTATFKEVIKQTAKMIEYSVIDRAGKIYTGKYSKTRLVAVNSI